MRVSATLPHGSATVLLAELLCSVYIYLSGRYTIISLIQPFYTEWFSSFHTGGIRDTARTRNNCPGRSNAVGSVIILIHIIPCAKCNIPLDNII